MRALDLRVTCLRNKHKDEIEYWCAHTFLTVPLIVVINDIKRFLDEYPSESVIVTINADYQSVNADYCGLVNFSRKERSRVVKPKYD